ncbi:hypothetical protein GCM10009597_13190 [Peribacillus frigoritolerans]
MNFKMQNKQNQLIERITNRHLVVGIDIAQQFHVARAVNYRGILVGHPLNFENNDEGFTKFLSSIKELKRINRLDTAIVGIHHWLNLSKWLVIMNKNGNLPR